MQRFLKARGLSFEDLASFKLGYLPQDSLTILEQRGFNKEELITFGHYNNLRASFFLPRLVFPIRRDPEDVVGFVFRSIDLEGNQAQAKQQLVRYINSNEDALFKKRENLYNLDRINQQANGESVFVVEGIFDVIALTKVGQRNTVALLGLNLSDEQIELLRGYELVLALDNDDAGRDSSLKIAIKLLENEIPFKILRPAVDLPKD